MIKHISFDLWMTLIKSHPEFKLKRSELIIKQFDVKTSSAKDIDDKIRAFDKIFDRYNELSRKKIPANEMYRRVLDRILERTVSESEAVDFREKADELFIQYTPFLLNEGIPQMLEKLASEGYILNLASNTGFIEGLTLRQSLADLGIFKYFTFSIFSDEVNTSKPSSYFFQSVYDHISVPRNQVLHIGDNSKTDYQGAKNFGFEAFLVRNPDYTIEDVKNYLTLLGE